MHDAEWQSHFVFLILRFSFFIFHFAFSFNSVLCPSYPVALDKMPKIEEHEGLRGVTLNVGRLSKSSHLNPERRTTFKVVPPEP
jgi:hypothetical protein